MLNLLICWWVTNSKNRNSNVSLYCAIELIWEAYVPTSISLSITICVSVSLCCGSRFGRKSLGRPVMTTWNAKPPSQRSGNMGWSRQPGEELPYTHQRSHKLFVLSQSHRVSGLVGMEMLCCGESCKCSYLTHGYLSHPGTGAIHCSYLRYNLYWLS